MKRMVQNHLIQLCCCKNGFLSATQQHPMHPSTAPDKMLELFLRCNSSLNLEQSPASLPQTIPVHYVRSPDPASLTCWKVPPPWSVSLFEKAMQVARCFLFRPSLLFHSLPVLLFLFTSGFPSSLTSVLCFFLLPHTHWMLSSLHWNLYLCTPPQIPEYVTLLQKPIHQSISFPVSNLDFPCKMYVLRLLKNIHRPQKLRRAQLSPYFLSIQKPTTQLTAHL